MAQISPSEDDVVQTGPESLIGSYVTEVAVALNSEPVRRHSSRQKRPHSKPPAKAKLQPEATLLVSREEAAHMLSISIRAMDYLIATKRISTRRIGTRVLIPIEDVRRFASSDHPEKNGWLTDGSPGRVWREPYCNFVALKFLEQVRSSCAPRGLPVMHCLLDRCRHQPCFASRKDSHDIRAN